MKNHADLAGAKEAFERSAELCAATLGPSHESTREAKRYLALCTGHLVKLFAAVDTAKHGRRPPSGGRRGDPQPKLEGAAWHAAVAAAGGRAGVQTLAKLSLPTEYVGTVSLITNHPDDEKAEEAWDKREAKLMRVAAAAARRSERLCLACGAPLLKTQKCSRCLAAEYCSGRCQQAHWGAHKGVCVPPQGRSNNPPSGRTTAQEAQQLAAPAAAEEAGSSAAAAAAWVGMPSEKGEPSEGLAVAAGAAANGMGSSCSGSIAAEEGSTPASSARTAAAAAAPAGELHFEEATAPGSADAEAGPEAEQPEALICAGCGVRAGRRRGGAGGKKKGVKLSACSRCLSVAYCGAACQSAHWKQHKGDCIQGQEQRAMSGGGGELQEPEAMTAQPGSPVVAKDGGEEAERAAEGATTALPPTAVAVTGNGEKRGGGSGWRKSRGERRLHHLLSRFGRAAELLLLCVLIFRVLLAVVMWSSSSTQSSSWFSTMWDGFLLVSFLFLREC